MSINDSLEKINPVKDRELNRAGDSIQQRPSVFNGVKLFLESDRGKDILIVIIVILVGLGGFGLGRLSKSGANAGIKIEYPSRVSGQPASVISSLEHSNILQNVKTSASKNFFASSRGSKYYPAGCDAGKSLKPENRIYFATKEEAEGAGYELSSSCR